MRKNRKIFNCFKKNIIFIFLIIIISCDSRNSSNIDINEWKKNHIKDLYIKLDTIKNTFFLFDGSPSSDNFLEGNLIVTNNIVFFKSSNYQKLTFPLFDFNLRATECKSIHYFKKKMKKEYDMCVEDIFYSEIRKDTIYKFCFKKYGIYNPNIGVVYFVSKTKGILGCYLVEYSNENHILRISSKKVGEIFKERYDYNSMKTFSIE